MNQINSRFAASDREQLLTNASKVTSDLLIIGGGITGAGIALDAALRGMSTVLVEMQDFAAGTSSRSTKLVHGGLRYLKQFEVKMVAEVGKERAVVYENGPHVTTPEWMLLPLHKGGTFGPLSTSIGLRVYDYLAGVKRSERRKMLGADETLRKEPLLKPEGLKGGGYYVEYRTDDARLTIEVMKEAAAQGANAINYAKVERLLYNDAGSVIGAHVVDQLSGTGYDIYARKVVNAAGPWVDSVREMDQSKKGKMLQLTKGVHIVIDQKRFPLRQAVYFDTPDGRMVFAIPRDGKTYVGTTDTVYKSDLAHPTMTIKDRTYLLEAIHYMFPQVGITADDIESSWAGVRPLIYEEGKDPSEISRKDEIWQSDSGLLTIAGGKLTGYRKMAEMVVDKVSEQLKSEQGLVLKAGFTKHVPISGGDVGGSEGYADFIARMKQEGVRRGISGDLAEAWARRYGSNVPHLFDLAGSDPNLLEQTGLPLSVLVPLRYAMEREMSVKPVDFFIRRTGALLFDLAWVKEWKKPVIAYMAAQSGWTAEQRSRYTEELDQQMHDAVVPERERAPKVKAIG